MMPINHQIVFTQPGVVELQPVTMPVLQPHQLLVRTRVSLISPGTERAFFLSLPNTTNNYPHYPGYSNIGEIVACGTKVSNWLVGTRVASAALHVHYAAVDADKCIPVPTGLADESAVFFNLTSIAMQGVRKARIELGESVVVVGAGLIGLLAMQLARLNGALPVITVDTDERRLAFAQQVHADAIVCVDEQLTETVAVHCGKPGADVVIEATGHPEAILTAFALARPGGRVILLGSTRGETEQVNFYRDVHKKGLTVIGAHNIARPLVESSPGWWIAQDDQRIALQLLALGRLSVGPLTTHHFAYHQASAAYARLQQWDTSTLGMVLDWST
jgi:2-desacetyl-2-hydroxyethyl bacteriochlorophyllide A dehydrogenase